MESVSAYSLQANKLCLILACASLIFLPRHVVAATASSVSRLYFDSPGNAALLTAKVVGHSDSVDGTCSRAESYNAAALIPHHKRAQKSQPLLNTGASKQSTYPMVAGRKLLIAAIPSPRVPNLPPVPPGPSGP